MKRFCFALAVLLPLTALATQPIVIFTIQDLGTLGGTIAIGTALNSNGVVAGSSYLTDDTGQDAFIGTASGLMDLGTLGGAQSFGNGVNLNGVVVGSSNFDSGFNQHAFFSGAGGGSLMDMGTLGGPNSIATGVNGAMQVSGYSLQGDGTTHAFLSATNAGSLQDLGTLPNGASSFANAVNASGQVAGYSNTATESGTVIHAFISDPNGGALNDMGTLGGDTSFANGLNDAGQVVGRSRLTASTIVHAFLSGPNGSGPLIDLNTLGDSGSSSEATGINNSGSVVGHSLLSDHSTQHAFLYNTKLTVMTDLNNLIAAGSGWELIDAKAINDAGQITGQGNINGEMHVYLLTPIPPSATISSITQMPNAHMLVQGVGSPPLQTFTVEATDDLTMGFQPLASVMAGNDGSLMFEDTDAPSFTQRFYRFTYP